MGAPAPGHAEEHESALRHWARGAGARARAWAPVFAVALLGSLLTSSITAQFAKRPDLDHLSRAAEAVGIGPLGRLTIAVLSLLLVIVDSATKKARGRFEDDLYQLLQEFGDSLDVGESIETAVHKACRRSVSGPAKLFRRALLGARELPFEEALAVVAVGTHQNAFRRIAGIIELAVATNGDTGRALRDMGERMAVIRTLEKDREAQLGGQVTLLRALGVLIIPLLVVLLSGKLTGSAPADLIILFIGVSAALASLDGFVFGRWARVPALLPLHLIVVGWAVGV